MFSFILHHVPSQEIRARCISKRNFYMKKVCNSFFLSSYLKVTGSLSEGLTKDLANRCTKMMLFYNELILAPKKVGRKGTLLPSTFFIYVNA